MGNIFVTSDWHFCHDREFIWKARGFASVEAMNNDIITKHNYVIQPDDDVYVLGDLMLGDSIKGIECVTKLNGKLHIVLGNHDTERRIELYKQLPNVVEVANAITLKYKKHHFYMSHYPTLTGNLEKESLTQMTLNLFGHTHQKDNFYMDMPFMYHVGVDSHSCFPIALDDIILQMHNKVKECKEFLDEPDVEKEPQVELVEEERIREVPEPYKAAAINWDYENQKCDKCVYFRSQCGGPTRYAPGKCPSGHSYKRDPPDGGYYG